MQKPIDHVIPGDLQNLAVMHGQCTSRTSPLHVRQASLMQHNLSLIRKYMLLFACKDEDKLHRSFLQCKENSHTSVVPSAFV